MSTHTVRSPDGITLQRSHNLRSIRTLAGKVTFEGISVRHAQSGGAYLDMQIAEGNGRWSKATYHTDFASFTVLIDFLSRWRNVYGTPLFIDGTRYGLVTSLLVSGVREHMTARGKGRTA